MHPPFTSPIPSDSQLRKIAKRIKTPLEYNLHEAQALVSKAFGKSSWHSLVAFANRHPTFETAIEHIAAKSLTQSKKEQSLNANRMVHEKTEWYLLQLDRAGIWKILTTSPVPLANYPADLQIMRAAARDLLRPYAIREVRQKLGINR
jgi:hypothetical protein